MDTRYTLVIDHLEQATAILRSVRGSPIELVNIIQYAGGLLRGLAEDDEPKGAVIDFIDYLDRRPPTPTGPARNSRK